MQRSVRTIWVIATSTAIAASLSLSLSGCKKHQVQSSQEAASNNPSLQSQTMQTQADKQANPQALAQEDLRENSRENSKEELKNGATAVGSTSGNTNEGQSPQTGAPVSNSASSTETTKEAPKVSEAPKEVPITFFFETFKHKKTPGHDSAEACSHHKNLVSVSHASVNSKSVCVRVNNVPVKYERVGKSDFLIGSIAGPDSTITVRYCIGQTSCTTEKKEDCQVPKDEFLDAIGGGDPDDGNVAQWENTGNNAADAKLNNDVKRELADIDGSAPEDHSTHVSVFKGWIDEKPAPACGQDTTKKQSS
jgi:hypothetical protein